MSTRAGSRRARAGADVGDQHWLGGYRPYDLVKEFVAALVAVTLLTAGLAALFSSPDEKQITIQRWASAASSDFVLTAATELDGSSATATYGQPYNSTPGAAQKIGPISLQRIPGVTTPIDTAADFVVTPLRSVGNATDLTTALSQWDRASADQRQAWAAAYDKALAAAPDNDPAQVADGDYGPVPVMLRRLLDLARSGGLDGALLASGRFYQTDYTRPMLFLADGTYLEGLAVAQHLGGDQWGMMNETGNYPGQAWLWLYTFWYQIEPFKSSGNADALVWGLMMVLSAGFVLVPFIPGVRQLPRRLRVYRVIWRDYYRAVE